MSCVLAIKKGQTSWVELASCGDLDSTTAPAWDHRYHSRDLHRRIPFHKGSDRRESRRAQPPVTNCQITDNVNISIISQSCHPITSERFFVENSRMNLPEKSEHTFWRRLGGSPQLPKSSPNPRDPTGPWVYGSCRPWYAYSKQICEIFLPQNNHQAEEKSLPRFQIANFILLLSKDLKEWDVSGVHVELTFFPTCLCWWTLKTSW